VQIPHGPRPESVPAAAKAPAATAVVPDGAAAREIAELRRTLAESQGETEGVVRVSRAQAEEIEELRARLRRGAEARAELDQEVTRLRRALTEADESVLSLTRKTTEEMASLAQRITAGLRPAVEASALEGGSGLTRAREELRRKQAELAERESALSDRDERIAGLEAERQDLLWRLQAAEDEARRPAARPAAARAANGDRPTAGDDQALVARLHEREQALEQYRRAASAHMEEAVRLREALAEQSTLVSELEDSLGGSESRAHAALEELTRLKRHAAEIEQADRARRSRLAEVEGTLLRLQRQTAVAAAAAATTDGAAARQQAERRIAELTQRVSGLEAELRAAEQKREEAERHWGDTVERMVGTDRGPAPSAARQPGQPAIEGARLDAALHEVSRLRDALERSEEQLWETKGQLLLDRERMAVLENQIASSPSEPATPPGTVSDTVHQAIVDAVLAELTEIEAGLRRETARLESMERTIETWRADLAVTEGDTGLPFSRAD
jgi:chromosome segregation ATPase